MLETRQAYTCGQTHRSTQTHLRDVLLTVSNARFQNITTEDDRQNVSEQIMHKELDTSAACYVRL